ncbi:hypothetical protein [Mucilaginibacter sp.]|uniref:hypothetical protein n=1 Tax=Mucilaginibacter sp. TaxID=1882438 RepID=UPI0032630071
MAVTNNRAVFNLDVTAGRRNGYHYFNTYGNIFLENRYTDWGNYYPYTTLRNLWMLSKYIPAQNLQIEFLNNYRNADKYAANDLLAPSKNSLDYEFALTMMAQPLAWMEATGLPEKAFAVAPVINKYRSLQADIHSGQIFPIGNEPSGTSWTGFQSIKKNEGYLLVIREKNKLKQSFIRTWLSPGQKLFLKAAMGTGRNQAITVNSRGEIKVILPEPNTYVLYHYYLPNVGTN